jgi:hypothetical protein
MSSADSNMTRSERAQRGPAIDGPTVLLALALLLLGRSSNASCCWCWWARWRRR